jgi:gluconolactonase
MIHRPASFLLYFAIASGLACDDAANEDTDTQALTPAPDAGGPNAAAPDAAAPTAAAPAQPPAIDTVAPGIPGVVAEGTLVEVIGEGFEGTEGPLPLPDLSLIFTETNANRVTRIAADDSRSVFLENSNGSNALAFDPEGRLVSVQTTPGQTQIGIIYPPGSEQVLTDNFEGLPYGRPNDLVIGTTGHLYFTEPGPNAAAGMTPPAPPLPPAVYHLPPGGEPERISDSIRRPNGIILSVDETTLFVNATQGASLIAFDVLADGSVDNQREFAAYDGVTTNADGSLASGADGLAIDSEGRLYVATTIGVQVFDAQGGALGTIPVSRAPQNLAFAGPNKQTLYIVGRGAAWKLATLASGFAGRAK